MGRDRDTAIIPLYEAQRLFGNIGEIVAANQAFLADLEELMAEGVHVLAARLGEVVLRHVSAQLSRGLEWYREPEGRADMNPGFIRWLGFRAITSTMRTLKKRSILSTACPKIGAFGSLSM